VVVVISKRNVIEIAEKLAGGWRGEFEPVISNPKAMFFIYTTDEREPRVKGPATEYCNWQKQPATPAAGPAIERSHGNGVVANIKCIYESDAVTLSLLKLDTSGVPFFSCENWL
jgi:hypothetical protein